VQGDVAPSNGDAQVVAPLRRDPRRPTMAPMVIEGARLRFETLEAGTAPQPLRLECDDDTLLRVLAGMIRLTVGDDEWLLAAGEEAVVPAGAPHRVAAAVGEARIVSGLRPPRR
jgi:mannose-6-phosphate isomerase-like protein (cupin superfamily)